jgi:hypothetical protein
VSGYAHQGLILVNRRGRDDRGNQTGRGGSQDEVAVHLAPLVAMRRLTQMVVAIIDPLTAIPVVVRDMATMPPVVMPHVVVGEGESTGHGHGRQDRKGDGVTKTLHGKNSFEILDKEQFTVSQAKDRRDGVLTEINVKSVANRLLR